MGTSDKNHLDIVDIFKSWIPRKTENTNVSKDFWMPDQSCRVCYECDSQFTVFNRKHHCRLCGRVFCAKCTSHSIPAPCEESKTDGEECEKIRVCNFCFNQWQQGILIVSDSAGPSSPVLSPSPSTSSLGSINSGYNDNSNCSNAAASIAHSSGSYDHVSYGSCMSSQVFSQASPCRTGHRPSEQSSINTVADAGGPSSHECSFSMSSDDEDKDVCAYQSDSDVRHLSESVEYNGSVRYDEINHPYQIYTSQHVEDGSDGKAVSPLSAEICTTQVMEGSLATSGEESYGHGTHGGCEASLYGIESTDFDKLDFENDVLLWLPPETEEEEDENEAIFFDDDEDGNASGEWGYPCSSCSSNAGDVRHRDKSNEEHRKAMRNVVSGHFRALIAQLLQIENLPVHERDNKESWLDIITTLSWEAAAFLKPDMSESGGMDPGGYVKVKCLASGQRSESKLIKGVACKKNVAHRRMISKFDRPRLLILAGALEYQRVSNQLSSFNTLLKQEMDHLKMAVTKIHAHHPNILLVEKSVSRFAQDYLLEKGISVVLNIKRPLLERIARCTGALIVPSVDHVSSQKLGYCDSFHVEKYFEQHGSAGQGGKKLMKTLMFLEGCPKPLGCTILLKGAHGDELKKVKHVLQYGVFAAYNLALETSFLADEGASLPELPLKSPITVALPDKASNISKAISTIPGFSVPAAGSGRALIDQLACDTQKSSDSLIFDSASPSKSDPIPSLEEVISCTQTCRAETSPDLIYSDGHSCVGQLDTCTTSSCLMTSKDGVQGVSCRPADFRVQKETEQFNPQSASSKQRMNDQNEELPSSKEIFPPSPSDNQSILVSLMTRCVWKGVVCERAHLFRIKYYGSFDRPLGRFLQDHLFDQSYRCKSCEMPSEAHIHCYTHREGSLTISVRKLSDLFSAEGKIWMWHRCLRCPRSNGFPPTTQRVVMSDAAWGLSFGKFLELSFSNHAATSRIACCGHSLHRDCLRFYGSGRMVACFRYAPIDVHSVCLPPAKLEFNYNKQDWIQKELNEVGDRAELLFTDVCNALNRISVEVPDIGSLEGSLIAYGLRKHIAELEKRLRKEKEEFEGLLQIVLNKEAEAGQPAIDILEINKLRRRLLFQSYVWDQRLVYAASLTESMPMHGMNSVLKSAEKSLNIIQGIETDGSSQHVKGSSSCRLNVSDGQPDTDLDFEGDLSRTNQPSACREELHSSHQINTKEDCEDVSPQITKLDPLESCYPVQRDLSDGQFPCMVNLSETLDAAWTGQFLLGNAASKENDEDLPIHVPKDSSNCATPGAATSILENYTIDNRKEVEVPHPLGLALPTRGSGNTEYSTSWLGMPFINLYCLLNTTDSPNTHTLDAVLEYKPVYLSSFCELKRHGGARLLLPIGINDTVVPVYDDEPTSIISYTLVSPDYHTQMSNSSEMTRDGLESSISLPNLDSSGDTTMESLNTQGSLDEKLLSAQGSWSNLVLDPFLYTKASHLKVSFVDDDPNGKVKYKVICYYSKRFEALRKMCCPSELDYIRSLSRCKKWGAQGGKSNVFFAKTLDDRFIIKQVTKTELESFIKFAPTYFKYLSESISTGSPTCLAKILGIYQVTSKHFNTGRESKMDVLVMENLLFQRNVTRLYDLKGSARSRYNPDSTGGNKVLLDQNLIETMPTSPIFVGNKAKRLLERAVWNDTPFLSSVDVMDYSLLVGLDDEKHELVLGIIDYMRQYTWDKHLESWVKATGILGGPKNASPTVISPGQYKKRFRKAMSTYFLVAPDHWCPLPPTAKSASQSDHQ